MASEENEDVWLFVAQVELSLTILILIIIALGEYSREFRAFVVWFVEIQIRERFRRLLAGQ